MDDHSLIYIKTNPKLSPKHIEFNQLVQSIDKLRNELDHEEKKLELFSDYYLKNIHPLKELVCKSKLEMVILLDEISEESRLPNATIFVLEIIIPELLSEVFEHLPPDDRGKMIFEKWSQANYDDIAKEARDENMEELSDYLKAMGVDFDTSDLDFDDPDAMEKFHQRIREAQEQIAEKEAHKRASKKKTKKQLAAEEIIQMQDDLKNKNLRSVYHSLAKILHPDSEIDPDLKLEKEEVMKQVTKAYEEKDIITLLVIETQWLKNTEDRLANIKEDVATIYIQLLKEQAKKLRQQKAELRYHPRFQHVATYLAEKVDRGMLRMSLQKETYEKEIRNTKREIEIIKSSPRNEVKKIIKAMAKKYEKEHMDDLMNFINVTHRF